MITMDAIFEIRIKVEPLLGYLTETEKEDVLSDLWNAITSGQSTGELQQVKYKGLDSSKD